MLRRVIGENNVGMKMNLLLKSVENDKISG